MRWQGQETGNVRVPPFFPSLFLFPPCLSRETDSKLREADTALNWDYNPEILDIPSVFAVLLDNVEENMFVWTF